MGAKFKKTYVPHPLFFPIPKQTTRELKLHSKTDSWTVLEGARQTDPA